MIKEVKYNRLITKLEQILNKCNIINNGTLFKYYKIVEADNWCILYTTYKNKVNNLNFEVFLEYGLSEELSEEEIIKHINRKLIKS